MQRPENVASSERSTRTRVILDSDFQETFFSEAEQEGMYSICCCVLLKLKYTHMYNMCLVPLKYPYSNVNTLSSKH